MRTYKYSITHTYMSSAVWDDYGIEDDVLSNVGSDSLKGNHVKCTKKKKLIGTRVTPPGRPSVQEVRKRLRKEMAANSDRRLFAEKRFRIKLRWKPESIHYVSVAEYAKVGVISKGMWHATAPGKIATMSPNGYVRSYDLNKSSISLLSTRILIRRK